MERSVYIGIYTEEADGTDSTDERGSTDIEEDSEEDSDEAERALDGMGAARKGGSQASPLDLLRGTAQRSLIESGLNSVEEDNGSGAHLHARALGAVAKAGAKQLDVVSDGGDGGRE
jgi:hypothetical protein